MAASTVAIPASFSSFGKRFNQYFGAGPEDSRRIADLDGKKAIVASIKAHGTGKNLQAFNRNLVVTPPADAGVWEQCIGRTFREGQKAEKVTVDVFQHVPELEEALEKATERAKYVWEASGSTQALLDAEWIDFRKRIR